MKIAHTVFSVVTVILISAPANAGLLDWLDLDGALNDKNAAVPDPAQGPVRVDMVFTMMDGGTVVEAHDYCDFRSSKDLSCTVKLFGVRDTLPIQGMIPDNWLKLTFTRWPHAVDMVKIVQNGRQYALLPSETDVSLVDLHKGNVGLALKAYGHNSSTLQGKVYEKQGENIASVTFKTSPDDRSSSPK